MYILVLKNHKTNEYSDGNYSWTMDIDKARIWYSKDIPSSHDHISFVELDKEKK
jgi:hypothetical protein